jgi:hypothetical protein
MVEADSTEDSESQSSLPKHLIEIWNQLRPDAVSACSAPTSDPVRIIFRGHGRLTFLIDQQAVEETSHSVSRVAKLINEATTDSATSRDERWAQLLAHLSRNAHKRFLDSYCSPSGVEKASREERVAAYFRQRVSSLWTEQLSRKLDLRFLGNRFEDLASEKTATEPGFDPGGAVSSVPDAYAGLLISPLVREHFPGCSIRVGKHTDPEEGWTKTTLDIDTSEMSEERAGQQYEDLFSAIEADPRLRSIARRVIISLV